MIDAKEIFTASLVLFAVIDIIGNIPLVISLREKVGHIQSEKASIIAAIIMVGFLFVGEERLFDKGSNNPSSRFIRGQKRSSIAVIVSTTMQQGYQSFLS